MKTKILKKVQTEQNIYTEAFKRAVCEEYLRKGTPKDQLKTKYGIKGKSAILIWLRKFGYIETVNKAQPLITDMANKAQPHDHQALQAKIKQLEKALEQAQLEKEAWKLMVEIAERELKIDIRKKSDTKQSKR